MLKTTAKSAQKAAQQIAKQMAQEPLELLKSARKQVLPSQEPPPQENNPPPPNKEEDVQKIKAKEVASQGRTLEALNREIEDIRAEKVFKDLQAKIASGEVVYLEEYPELTPEQKQVLQAQIEAVATQKAKEEAQKPAPKPTSKPGRKMFGGLGQKREQQRVEIPKPPSG